MSTERDRPVEIPEHTLRRLAGAGLAEVQLARLGDEMARVRAGTIDPTIPNAYLEDLEKERAHLLAGHAPEKVDVDVSQARLDGVVSKVGDLLFPWSVLELPYVTEGFVESPSTSDADGAIVTAELGAGSLAYGGVLSQDGSGGPKERWWVHTWSNSAVFPTAPVTGRLYYRFAVDAECNIYRAPVVVGSIHEYVTIATVGDVSTSPPIDEWKNWETAGWPIVQSLPLPSTELDLFGGVDVSGSIPVNAGSSAAIAFIYGTVFSVAGGLVQLLYGNFGTRRHVAPGGTVSYRDYDKIEYRFEPSWWVKAVEARLAGAPRIQS